MIEIERAIEKKEYIERGAALELFWEYSGNWNLINAIPDADVEPVVRGEWKEETFDCSRENWDVEYKCSACGKVRYSISNYCPNCGAHMMDETKLRPAIIEQIPTARLRELAEAERDGRILILWKPIEENDGMFTVLYRRPDGVLMGRTDHTAEEAVKNATADYDRALAEKGAADDHK